MKKFMKIMGIAALMTGMTTGAMAQEQTQETEKPGFFKQAFRDMKESAKRQREIDKANFKAQKMETKAFYQEQKRLSNPKVRSAAEKQRMERQLAEAWLVREDVPPDGRGAAFYAHALRLLAKRGDQPRMRRMEEQIRETASVFAMDMLILKFIQGFPVVGILGGIANPIYYNRVLRYVQLKYRKRYLLKQTDSLGVKEMREESL